MSATAAITLVGEILANLPGAVVAGQQVIQLINDGWAQMKEAIGDRDATPEEIKALVAKIVANSARIQAID
jgi:hypothetical protein